MRQGSSKALWFPLLTLQLQFRPSITLDSSSAIFTNEFVIRETPSIPSCVTGSLDAARVSAPVSRATRFTFAIGAGVKTFSALHWDSALMWSTFP